MWACFLLSNQGRKRSPLLFTPSMTWILKLLCAWAGFSILCSIIFGLLFGVYRWCNECAANDIRRTGRLGPGQSGLPVLTELQEGRKFRGQQGYLSGLARCSS